VNLGHPFFGIALALGGIFAAMVAYGLLYDRYCAATGHDPDGSDMASPREVLGWAFRRQDRH
jgi:hypothetical protein